MAPLKINFGSICFDQTTHKKLAVVGIYQNSHKKDKINASALGTDVTLVKTMDLDGLEGEICTTHIAQLKPLVNANDSNCERLAQTSAVLMHEESLKTLL